MSKKPVKFCTDFFYGVDFLSTGTMIKVMRILIPAVPNMITYEIKILNYYNYSPIPGLFNHHGVNVIVKCRKIYGVAYTFCMKLVRLSDV